MLPSNKNYSDEDKKFIYILFKEILREGVIKKGEHGSEIIEEILLIGEMTNRKKDIINMKENVMNYINDLIRIAKEKGFEGENVKNKNKIILDFIFFEWKHVCKEDVYLFSFILFMLHNYLERYLDVF